MATNIPEEVSNEGTIIEFLLGEKSYFGYFYGEQPPNTSPFWWRSGLKKFVDSLSKSHPSASVEDGDTMSISSLLSEFKRQGFNTENWDGDEGAEKAIVDGVVSFMASQQTPAPIQEEQEELELWEEFFERWQLFCGQEKRLGNNISVGEFYNDEKQEYSLIKK